MNKLENKFSFSFSRYETAKSCLRKYFFSYYFNWEGWLFTKDIKDKIFIDDSSKSRKAQAYIFKKSTGKYLYVGNYIHELIDKSINAIKNGRFVRPENKEITIEKHVNLFASTVDSIFENQSKNLFLSQPKVYPFFVEYINSSSFDNSSKLPLFDEVKFRKELVDLFTSTLRNFFDLGVYDSLVKLFGNSSQFLSEYDEKIHYNYNGFDIPISLKPDLLFVNNGKLNILDWKTGKLGNAKPMQMHLYGYLYDYSKIKVDYSEKNIKILSLKDGSRFTESVMAPEMVESELNKSLDFLSMLVEEGNLDSNIIRDSSEENFAKNIDNGKFGCVACPFYNICVR